MIPEESILKIVKYAAKAPSSHNTQPWSFKTGALTATKYQVRHSHVNMPCEEPEVREKVITDFQLKDLTPLLLIRFGFCGPMPYSFRRNINDLIDQ